MDRYNNVSLEEKTLSRVEKNDSLYEDIKTSDLRDVRTNNNIRVLESNGKTINLDKIRKYVEESREKPRERRSVTIEVSTNDKEETQNKTKEYDILSVLEKAKQNRSVDYETERYKKLRTREYDILKEIETYSVEEDPLEEEEELNTGERTIVDLINTVTIHKGGESLLSDLLGGSADEVTLPINEERTSGTLKEELKEIDLKKAQEQIDREKLEARKREVLDQTIEDQIAKTKELALLKEKTMDLDRSFFTNSMSFSKEDFEGFEELEKSVKKNNALTKVMLGLLVLFIIITLVVIANYVFNLGLF